jgi:calcineurin-like phosphoesterase family protein
LKERQIIRQRCRIVADPRKIFFISDTHFGHKNIIRSCGRPFNCELEMDCDLMENWNDMIGKDDIVFHLGDFCHWRKDPKEYLKDLNGRIILCRGNHDRDVSEFEFSDQIIEVSINGQDVVMCHYPMRAWNKSHYGSWHLYGHTHEKFRDRDPDSLSLNVGCDYWEFRPITFQQVQNMINFKKNYLEMEKAKINTEIKIEHQ